MKIVLTKEESEFLRKIANGKKYKHFCDFYTPIHTTIDCGCYNCNCVAKLFPKFLNCVEVVDFLMENGIVEE